jgi:hypothetical protein
LNKAQFLSILGNLNRVSIEDTGALRTLSEAYPSAALVQMIYLKALQEENSFLYQKQLKRTALVVPDRKLLYAFLNPEEKQAPIKTVDPVLDVQPSTEITDSQIEIGQTNEGHIDQPVPKADKHEALEHDVENLQPHSPPHSEVVPVPAASTEGDGRKDVNPLSDLKDKETPIQHTPEKILSDADEKPKEQTVPPAKATVSATRITETGKVEIDLDRLPPRARAVIERSMALRAKFNKDKSDQAEKQISQPKPPVQTDDADSADTFQDSNVREDQVFPALEESTESKSVVNEAISERQADHILEAFIPSDAIENADADLVFESDQQVHEEQVELDDPPTTVMPDIEQATGAVGFPFLVFSANEIEEVEVQKEQEQPQIFFEPTAPPTETQASDQVFASEMAAPHTFFEWLQIAESGILPSEKPLTLQSPEDKMKLIDAFLEKVPAIKPVKGAIISKPNLVIQQQPQAMETLMTETLAGVYVSQKHYDEALRAYEILRLKYPEKSSYFADLISKVKKLKNSSQ